MKNMNTSKLYSLLASDLLFSNVFFRELNNMELKRKVSLDFDNYFMESNTQLKVFSMLISTCGLNLGAQLYDGLKDKSNNLNHMDYIISELMYWISFTDLLLQKCIVFVNSAGADYKYLIELFVMIIEKYLPTDNLMKFLNNNLNESNNEDNFSTLKSNNHIDLTTNRKSNNNHYNNKTTIPFLLLEYKINWFELCLHHLIPSPNASQTFLSTNHSIINSWNILRNAVLIQFTQNYEHFINLFFLVSNSTMTKISQYIKNNGYYHNICAFLQFYYKIELITNTKELCLQYVENPPWYFINEYLSVINNKLHIGLLIVIHSFVLFRINNSNVNNSPLTSSQDTIKLIAPNWMYFNAMNENCESSSLLLYHLQLMSKLSHVWLRAMDGLREYLKLCGTLCLLFMKECKDENSEMTKLNIVNNEESSIENNIILNLNKLFETYIINNMSKNTYNDNNKKNSKRLFQQIQLSISQIISSLFSSYYIKFPHYIESMIIYFKYFLNNIITKNISIREMKKLEQTIILVFNENNILSIKNRNIYTIMLAYQIISISSEYMSRMSTNMVPILHMISDPHWKSSSTTDGILVPEGHSLCLVWYIVVTGCYTIINHNQNKNQNGRNNNTNELRNNQNDDMNNNDTVLISQLFAERSKDILTLLDNTALQTPLTLVPTLNFRIQSSMKLVMCNLINEYVIETIAALDGPHMMVIWDLFKLIMDTCLLYLGRTSSMLPYLPCQDNSHKYALLLLSKTILMLREFIVTSSSPR